MDIFLLLPSFAMMFADPMNLAFIVVGVVAGIFAGALPGLTATTGAALLIPFTFGRDPLQGLLLLIGVYIGAIYGGSISSILIRTPGTPAAAATLLDGFPMTEQGRAGRAIGLATVASFVGGTIGALTMALLAPSIASFGLRFGPPEFFALALFGLSMIVMISSDSILKGAIAALLGLLITTVGLDPISGIPRFTFGSMQMLNGIEFIPALIGLFGFAQVFRGIETMGSKPPVKSDLTRILPKLRELLTNGVTLLKSSFLGCFIGSIPGAGCDIAAFAAYGEAKRSSRKPETFGRGAPAGVLAPEAANNAATGGAMVPMLTLGVPGDAATAVLLGALTIHGFQPGPVFFQQHLDLIYPLFAGIILAQVVLLATGLLGARLFGYVVRTDPRVFSAVVFFLCVLGSYSMRFSFFDVYVALILGGIAYVLTIFRFPMSPILLALVLGPIAEQNLRRSLMLSQGDPMIFVERPLALAFIVIALLALASALWRTRRSRLRETLAKNNPDLAKSFRGEQL